MKQTYTSLLNEQETPFIVPGPKGTDWNATKDNFFHLAKVAYYFTVSQCDKCISHDDMRDPDAVIVEALRDNTEPVINVLKYYEQQGMPESVIDEIKSSSWMRMTKKDVIRDLSTEAKKMRERKIYLRNRREEHRKNGL